MGELLFEFAEGLVDEIWVDNWVDGKIHWPWYVLVDGWTDRWRDR